MSNLHVSENSQFSRKLMLCKKLLFVAAFLVPVSTFATVSSDFEIENFTKVKPVLDKSVDLIKPNQMEKTVKPSWQTQRFFNVYRYNNEDAHKRIGENKVEWSKRRDPEYYNNNCVRGTTFNYDIHWKNRIRKGFQDSNGYCRNYQETDVYSKRGKVRYSRPNREVQKRGSDTQILTRQVRYHTEVSGKDKLLKLLGVK